MPLSFPSHSPREKRKAKLRMRFRGRIDEELARTLEKAELLREIKEDARRKEGPGCCPTSSVSGAVEQ